MRSLAIVVTAAVCAVILSRASASDVTELKPNQIQFLYVPPTNPEHRRVYELFKERRVLEKFQEFLSPVRLPRPLLLKLEGCDGDVNAWYDYDTHAVTVCYELLKLNADGAPKKTTPAGVTPEDAVIGPAAEIFLHESAHAMFDLLEIPVLGREEDAADQVAAYILLQFGNEDSRRLIGGIAYMYGTDAKNKSSRMPVIAYADEHGTPGQRYFNYLCLAYGKNPELFAEAVTIGQLPKDRADRCAAEYSQVEFAFNKLIAPHLDPSLRMKVKSKRWIKPKTDK